MKHLGIIQSFIQEHEGVTVSPHKFDWTTLYYFLRIGDFQGALLYVSGCSGERVVDSGKLQGVFKPHAHSPSYPCTLVIVVSAIQTVLVHLKTRLEECDSIAKALKAGDRPR